ncbi:MAG: aminotransferase class I/II-fold pyridoxal phosphate-dependent enzyme [Acutalibacteraceae bacterium]
MAGLRLGYGLSADGALLRKMSAAVPPWNVSALAQAAGVAALGDAEFWRGTARSSARNARGSKNGCGSLASGCVRRRRITFCFAVRRAWRIGCASAALRSATVRILRAWGRDGIARSVRLREENDALLDAMRRAREDGRWR